MLLIKEDFTNSYHLFFYTCLSSLLVMLRAPNQERNPVELDLNLSPDDGILIVTINLSYPVLQDGKKLVVYSCL